MQRKFGDEALWVWEVLRGVDRNEGEPQFFFGMRMVTDPLSVKEKAAITKSMLASKNLPRMITKPSQGIHWLRILASELYVRLLEAREQTPTLWPKTLTVKTSLGWKMARSKQMPFAFTRNLTNDTVFVAAEKLWREMVGVDATAPPDMKFTHIGLAFGGVAALGSNQSGIEGFLAGGGQSNEGEERCQKCNAVLKVPPCDVEELEAATERARLEHEDWHFARDLARAPGSSPEPEPEPVRPTKKRKTSSEDSGKAKKKKKPEPVGIAKYFAKK